MIEWDADNPMDMSRAWIDDAVDSWLVPAGCDLGSGDDAWILLPALWLVVTGRILMNDMSLIDDCEALVAASPSERAEQFYGELTESWHEDSLQARDQQLVRSFLDRWDKPINRSNLETAAQMLSFAHTTNCENLLQ